MQNLGMRHHPMTVDQYHWFSLLHPQHRYDMSGRIFRELNYAACICQTVVEEKRDVHTLTG
jgi:hypothetical protein